MGSASVRLPFLDALKTIASQLIVLHHLAFYGPLSESAHRIAPTLINWLSDHARAAVQIFLVIGGFLAARMLAPQGTLRVASPLAVIGRRYLRLVVPYVLVLALAIVAAAIARAWMQHDSIPGAPTPAQVIAHILLLNDVAGFEALSAGVWYVAIDFQLFVLLVASLWLAQGLSGSPSAEVRLAPLIVIALGLASLFGFNRDPVWDAWALYFFGAYAMGALAFWASSQTRGVLWLIAALPVVLVALALDFRPRIAVASGVAALLVIARCSGLITQWPRGRVFAFLGRIAYSVFLVHFPICLLVNAAWLRFLPAEPWLSAVGVIAAWTASLAAGALFYRVVERPVGNWIARPQLRPQPA